MAVHVMVVDVMVVGEAADPMTIEDSADPGLTRSLVLRSPSQSQSPSRPETIPEDATPDAAAVSDADSGDTAVEASEEAPKTEAAEA